MDEITLGASVAEQLQDLVISSQDVNGFLAELCVLSASALSRTLGQEVSCAVTLNRHHRTTTAAWSDPAAGIILGQNRCSQAEAMSILTKASSSRNQKLRLVAEKLVESFVPEAPATHFDG